MKILLTLLIGLLTLSTYAQLPYQKDKKWGISRDGTGDDKDSIIYRADYEKIELVGDVIYAGFRNDEWQFLTKNKLVNQQRYEAVEVPFFVDGQFAVGSRTGYIDVISVNDADFVVRGVQAAEIVSSDNLFGNTQNVMLTQKEEMYGLVNIELKKEVLKAKYSRIAENLSLDIKEYPVLAYAEGTNYICALDGSIIFQFKSEEPIVAFEKSGDVADCFVIHVNGKKGTTYGFYDSKNKWVIPPIYDQCESMDNTSDAIIVRGAKGVGLYFQGKMMLDCIYMDIVKSEKRGYIAKVIDKKGEKYLNPEGKLEVVKE